MAKARPHGSVSARTTRRGAAAKSSPQAKSSAKAEYSLGREIFTVSLGCLGVLAGLVVFVACVGFWYGSRMIVDVLHEIGEHDFTGPMERINHYEVFFESLTEQGYEVAMQKPSIDLGVTTYFWKVQPQGSEEFRVFRWIHDLEANEVLPQTNAALLLDLELGYVTEEKAREHDFIDPKERYDTDDLLAQAIVQKSEFSLLPPTELESGWIRETPPEGPVGAPLLTPDEARQRQVTTEEEKEGDEAAGEGGVSEATEVETGSVNGEAETDDSTDESTSTETSSEAGETPDETADTPEGEVETRPQDEPEVDHTG